LIRWGIEEAILAHKARYKLEPQSCTNKSEMNIEDTEIKMKSRFEIDILKPLYRRYIVILILRSPFCLPFGKAVDTPSPALSRVRDSSLQLHP